MQADGGPGGAFETPSLSWRQLQTAAREARTLARLDRAHRPGERRPRVPRAEQAHGEDVCPEGERQGGAGQGGEGRGWRAKALETEANDHAFILFW